MASFSFKFGFLAGIFITATILAVLDSMSYDPVTALTTTLGTTSDLIDLALTVVFVIPLLTLVTGRWNWRADIVDEGVSGLFDGLLIGFLLTGGTFLVVFLLTGRIRG